MLLMGRSKQIPVYMLYCLLALTVDTIIGHTSKMIDSKTVQAGMEQQDSEHSGDELKKF